MPTPCTTCTLRCLASPARPLVSCPTTVSFQPASFSRSSVGFAERRGRDRPWPGPPRSPPPCAAAPWTECSRRSGTRRRASGSARPARCRGRDPPRGMRPCSRPGRRRAPRPGSAPRSPRSASSSPMPMGGPSSVAPSPPPISRKSSSSSSSSSLGGVVSTDAAAPVASAVRSMMWVPSETRSPTLTWTADTTPARGAGTSMLALSLSRVMTDCSASTLSPGGDQHLDDLHIGEVADVGNGDLDGVGHGSSWSRLISSRKRCADDVVIPRASFPYGHGLQHEPAQIAEQCRTGGPRSARASAPSMTRWS